MYQQWRDGNGIYFQILCLWLIRISLECPLCFLCLCLRFLRSCHVSLRAHTAPALKLVWTADSISRRSEDDLHYHTSTVRSLTLTSYKCFPSTHFLTNDITIRVEIGQSRNRTRDARIEHLNILVYIRHKKFCMKGLRCEGTRAKKTNNEEKVMFKRKRRLRVEERKTRKTRRGRGNCPQVPSISKNSEHKGIRKG